MSVGNCSSLNAVPVRSLNRRRQRAHEKRRYAVQRLAVPDRHRPARRVVAPALQAGTSGRRRVAVAARLRRLVRDDPRLGVPLHAAHQHRSSDAPSRTRWPVLVSGRDVLKVSGRWCYLYRAIDRYGHLLASMLSEHRDRSAARRFLRGLVEVSGRPPLRVTTDHHGSYPKAIRWICGRKVIHRRDRYLNNRTEQSHRPLKQRYYPMLGFGNFESASRFCSTFDEVHNYFRNEGSMSSAERRSLFMSRWRELIKNVSAA